MNEQTRWGQVKVIFDEAIRFSSGPELERYLDKACVGDLELRRELDSLLKTYEANTGFLEAPALSAAGALFSAQLADPQIDNKIGPYLVTRRVGEGGMGVVYEAIRIDGQFHQRVAIKLVKRGMDTDYILGRFRNERQILASLTHPNIARLLDGGATPAALPYFVMEFIEGKPIDEYCRGAGLDLSKRVELIRQVANAVGYAHARQIIHRDIKPGNVLVAEDGTPKLLDFGIAKLLTGDGTDAQTRTLTEFLILTPDYSSPEQLRGEPATKLSDIFSLGLVLYELSSGQKAKTLSAGRALRQLPRGIQLVIQRAAHPDCERRYTSMVEFEADLGNYLRGECLAARPDSPFYRLRRTLRPHATILWIALLILLASLSALIALFSPKSPSGRRKSVAVVGFQNTTGAANTAWLGTALGEMLNTELGAGDKLRTLSGESVARMKSDLSLKPSGAYSPGTLHKIAANLYTDYVLTGSYLATGDKSDLLLRLDLRLQDVNSGDPIVTWTDTGTPSELPALATRAGVRFREALGVKSPGSSSFAKMADPETQRLYAEGIDRIRSFDALGARARFERLVAENPSDPLGHAALADALATLGYSQRAAEEAKLAADKAAGLSPRQRLEVQATYHRMLWDWAAATTDYRKLWSLFPDDLDYGLQLASVETKAADLPAARRTISEIRQKSSFATDARVDLAEASVAETAGDPHRELALSKNAEGKARHAGQIQLAAEALYYEAWSQWLLGDLAGAERTYADAANIFAQAGNQLRVVDMKSGLANVLLDEGKPTEAATLLEGALTIAKKLGHRSLEGAMGNNLAQCWEALGQLKKAQRAYEHSYLIDKELNLKPNMAISLTNIGGVLEEQGDFAAAEAKASEGLALAREIGRKSTITMALAVLAGSHLARGRLDEAENEAAESLVVANAIDRKTTIASALLEQGQILRARRKWAEARAKYNEAAQVASAAAINSKLAEIRVAQALLSADQRRFDAGAKFARQALAEYQKEKNTMGQAWSSAVLAQILIRQGRSREAESLVPAGQFEDFETESQIAKVRAMLTNKK